MSWALLRRGQHAPVEPRHRQSQGDLRDRFLKGRYHLTVVDRQRTPGTRSGEDRVVVAPTLIRHLPLPERRMMGDLSQTDRVLATLDLPATP